MKVVFNGTIVRRTSGGGCNCKGKTTGTGFVRNKAYILPSGGTRVFYAGQPVDVTEEDARFLLSYVYKDANGDMRQVFSKVEE